ncbi:MAG: hypothetical protein NWR70_08065 [Algoriphagus sp.]|uniref:hypothetical protein n=1 Tax=Algoriphagus sp. TaxID=1872435 RepID=UPI0027673870|nr:hypothetical protein [Algoriphagus sp.]
MHNSLKSSLNKLIAEIEDEEFLIALRDFLQFKKANSPGKLWNELPKENQEAIFLALEEAENPANLLSRLAFLKPKNSGKI